MSDIPQAAIDAAAAEICDDECTSGCRDKALRALEAAEGVWPHGPAKRSPESTVHASLTIASSPYKPPAAARAEVFGFGPPGGWT